MVTLDKPDWMKIGRIVRVAEWIGLIVDIAHCESGKIMICVESPKGHFHGHRPEWLDYNDIPGMIAPASADGLEADADMYLGRLLEKNSNIRGIVFRAFNTRAAEEVLSNGHE